jgi:hypothetical protein
VPSALYTLYAGILEQRSVLLLLLFLIGGAVTMSTDARCPSDLQRHYDDDEHFANSAKQTWATTMMKGRVGCCLASVPALSLLVVSQLDMVANVMSVGYADNRDLHSLVAVWRDEKQLGGITMVISGILVFIILQRLSVLMSVAASARVSWTALDVIDPLICFSACCVEWLERAPLVAAFQLSFASRNADDGTLKPWELSAAASQHDCLVWWNHVLAVHAIVLLFVQSKRTPPTISSHTPPRLQTSATDATSQNSKAPVITSIFQSRATNTTIAKAHCWTTSLENDCDGVVENAEDKKRAFSVGVQTAFEHIASDLDTLVEAPTGQPLSAEIPAVLKGEEDTSSNGPAPSATVPASPTTAVQMVTGRAAGQMHYVTRTDAGDMSGVSELDVDNNGESANRLEFSVSRNVGTSGSTSQRASTSAFETENGCAATDGTADDKVSTTETSKKESSSTVKQLTDDSVAEDDRGDMLTEVMFGIAAAVGVMLVFGGTRRLLQRYK